MKRKAIIIGEEPQKESKGIEFTHYLNGEENGWESTDYTPQNTLIEKIVYLGKCSEDGDMFAAYFSDKTISIFSGNLNNGTY